MKRLFALTFVTGLVFVACSEQREADRAYDRTDREQVDSLQTEQVSQRSTANFRESVEAVLEDANRKIDQLADSVATVRGKSKHELETALEDARRRHATLRRDVRRLDRDDEAHDSTRRAAIRRQLNRLQRELETAQLTTIRSRRAFVHEVQAHVEGVAVQMDQLDRHLQSVDRPMQSDYQQPMAELEDRCRKLEQQLITVRTAQPDEYGDLRRQLARDVAALKADVRQLAGKVDRADERQPGRLDGS